MVAATGTSPSPNGREEAGLDGGHPGQLAGVVAIGDRGAHVLQVHEADARGVAVGDGHGVGAADREVAGVEAHGRRRGLEEPLDLVRGLDERVGVGVHDLAHAVARR